METNAKILQLLALAKDLSKEDKQTMHELNILLDLCMKHNDAFTEEERMVLGKCIGMYIGTFESEMMTEVLTKKVVDIFYNQIKET